MLSKRFISAYNRIDKKLRTSYAPANATFSDAVRRAVTRSSVVRKYEDDLLDYARLRNAIVHNSNTDMVIAEPHISVVENIEHIERLLLRPPLAVGTVAKPAVTVEATVTLRKVMELMAKSGYSNVPVMRADEIIGVVNHKAIVESLAKVKNVDAFLETTAVENILSNVTRHFCVLPDTATVDEVLMSFTENRKLQIVLLTPHGDYATPIRGVVTTGDLIDVAKIMDEY